MNITFTHNGFHGRNEITIRATEEEIKSHSKKVSATTAKRISDIVCGCESCGCGEASSLITKDSQYRGLQAGWEHTYTLDLAGLTDDENEIVFDADVRGYYPQR